MPEIAKVRYTHDAVIDEIIANPAVSQGELAAKFGFTQTWMSIIVNSDAFKYRLESRKAEIVDPKIRASVEERLDGLAKRALDKLMDRIDNNMPFSNADLIQAAKLGVVGKGANGPKLTQNNNLYVIQAPEKAENSSHWLKTTSRAEVIDISHSNPEV